LREVFSECPKLWEKSCCFADRPCQEVRDSDGVLYVRQKEDAVTFDGDRLQDGKHVRLCGTEDVLTCHVVILHHPDSRVTAIAHFDEYVKEARLKRYVSDFGGKVADRLYSLEYDIDEDAEEWEWEEVDGNDEPELSDSDIDGTVLVLVGGYDDEAKKSAAISTRILSFFSKHNVTFRLELCCLGKANTVERSRPARPKVGGVIATVSSKDFKVSPASFQRSFVNHLSEEAIKLLMLGPSLVKKPNKLKKLILANEDTGFSKSGHQQGPICGL